MKLGLKILLFSLLGLLLLFGFVLGYAYYQIEGKYVVDKERYTHYIGYLPYTVTSSEFKICDEERIVGWFASAATYVTIYRGGKTQFKKFIRKNYKKVNETDNGFLNLRFIINCEGEVGRMEVNELDDNYEKTKLSPEFVQQMIALSSRNSNWAVPKFDSEKRDSYMYLIYKIKNGEITEILP